MMKRFCIGEFRGALSSARFATLSDTDVTLAMAC